MAPGEFEGRSAMKNWITRLFGAGGNTTPAPAAVSVAADAAAAPTVPRQDPAPTDVDLMFWHWLSAGAAAPGPAPHTRLVLAELARLTRDPAAGAELVPRVPEIIPQLLRSLRDEGVSGAELARQVGKDPSLTAEVIREANSPFYRQGTQVRTIDAALLVLGQNGLRMLLARAAFRPIAGMQGGAHARLAAPRIWSHTEHCALAASLLAVSESGLRADPFEAYLAGLMQDVGLIVALRLFDQAADAGALPQDLAAAAQLQAAARQLSARIALQWELPPPVAAAILGAAAPEDATPLAQVLAQADRLARLRLLLDGGLLAAEDPVLSSLDRAAARTLERLAPADL
jgi:HD-like signal output (HDOD) protein